MARPVAIPYLRRMYTRWGLLAGAAVLAGVTPTLADVAWLELRGRPLLPRTWVGAAARHGPVLLSIVAVNGGITLSVWRLRRALEAAGYRACPACVYDARDLGGGGAAVVCPECGHRFEPGAAEAAWRGRFGVAGQG